eukprot:TRINITY_DN54740_c0_g1_i1.p1 TRINITY_DN54740_c0_g1~~TRINITY_DN54740_c0_g1_i1.p1  ORF type:complete len:581 (-),score=71.04 TRINITY_DN54740_c0_g1_i1:232-1974(-)
MAELRRNAVSERSGMCPVPTSPQTSSPSGSVGSEESKMPNARYVADGRRMFGSVAVIAVACSLIVVTVFGTPTIITSGASYLKSCGFLGDPANPVMLDSLSMIVENAHQRRPRAHPRQPHQPHQPHRPSPPEPVPESAPESGCHDIVSRDRGRCREDIEHARKRASAFPERYPGLTNTSTMKAWQTFLYRTTRGRCPMPCGYQMEFPCPNPSNPSQAAMMWKPSVPSGTLRVRILSYNLYWWNLFGIRKGNHNSASNLIKQSMGVHFDFMGFQECENYTAVLDPAGLLDQYNAFLGAHALCMAYRNSAWSLLGHGEADVAEDQPMEYYGTRGTQWMRLRHLQSNATALFLNHHGPLSVNSGGQCGGAATAHHLMKLIVAQGIPGDIVVLAGDFNANAGSLTIQELWKHLVLIYNSKSFGGVDNLFSNVERGSVSEAASLGQGGSDHEAIAATLELREDAGNRPLTASSSEPAKAIKDAANSQCGLLESNTKYLLQKGQTWSQHRDRVSEPRICCTLCKNDRRCKNWEWIEWVGTISGPRCTLRGGDVERALPRAGIVSGLPPAGGALMASRVSAGAIREL